MSKYTFSCWVKKDVPVLKRRSWWDLFGKDEIVYKLRWVRVVLNDLNEEQSQAIQKADVLKGAWYGLFVKALGNNLYQVQLEDHSKNVS